MLPNLSQLVLIVLLNLLLNCSLVPGSTCILEDEGPNIQISALPEQIKFQDDDNHTVLVTGVGVEFRIDCWAPYPIDVQFNGHLSNRDATVHSIERRVEDFNDVSTYCFYINITLTSYEEITGSYTCYGIGNKNSTSYYVFYAAHPPEILLNRGQTILIQMDEEESSNEVVLPCPSSNPEGIVDLFLEDGRGDFLQIETNPALVHYDPKLGFIIKRNFISYRSSFKCRGHGTTEQDFVIIKIMSKPEPEFIFEPLTRIIILEEGQDLSINCTGNRYVRVRGDYDSQRGILHQGMNRMMRNNQQAKYTSRFKLTRLEVGDSGLVSCYDADNVTVIYDWSFRVENGSNGKSEKKSQILDIEKCKISALNQPTLSYFECNNWIECKLRQCKMLDRKCQSRNCDDSKTTDCLPNGIIQCFDQQKSALQSVIYYSGIFGNATYYTSSEIVSTENLLALHRKKVPKHALNSNSNKVEISLSCEGSSFAFATGFQWFTYSKRNNLTQNANGIITHKWKNHMEKNILMSTIRLNVSIIEGETVDTILCKAPVWNSVEWKEVEYDLKSLFEKLRSRIMILSKEKQASSSSRNPVKILVIVISLLVLYLNSNKLQ